MIKYLLLFSLLLSSYAFADQATDKAEFKKLYEEFNELYSSSQNIEPIVAVGKKLIKIAPKAYGRNSKNNAIVHYNMARLYDETSNGKIYEYEEIASEYYKKYFKILDKSKTPKDETYFDHYIELINTEMALHGIWYKNKYLNNLLSMASKSNIPVLKKAEIEVFVANQRYLKDDKAKALKIFISALNKLETIENTNKLTLANAYLGKALIHFDNKNYKDAEVGFQLALKNYEELETIDKNILANSHKNLARLYVETGKYDLAASHGEQVTKFANNPKEMFLPIVRKEPLYPSTARRHGAGGYVVIKLTIDTEGKTKNITVVESSSSVFEENAIKAVEGFRYIPQSENGTRIEVPNVMAVLQFGIASRKYMYMKAM
ncbi:TonB family protein [Pseudemcibacter aquimaris]|uniref:TonB family protein n=1 Tax=Pseudemcibacter aquimaris TaxID=2857064 RepID=UPI0020130511|nr:TonB family protein [Pseudemcibacter aquimaris]MCC3860087.1 TonB family protein [Pseudemcibacter aquimaris]WDU57416.1 TonB family protein [Pseudemcibacter aquimaris]